MRSRVLAGAAIAFLFVLESASVADTPPNDGACFPACRAGFVCSPDRQCVSACNPMCGPDQECSAGECVTSKRDPEQHQSDASVPLDDPKERRRLAPLSLGVRAGLGADFAKGGDGVRASIDQEGPAIAVGVDLRKYFTRIMGAHAAATALFGFGTGALIGVVVDATLRIGPFGRGFPLYLGAGVWMGPAEVFRNGDSALGFYGGGVVEGGFLFGEGDRFDVGLRGQIGIATSGNAGTYSGVVMFGYRL